MNSGLITQEDFWTVSVHTLAKNNNKTIVPNIIVLLLSLDQILLSTDLNLQLNNVDIQILQDNIQADAQGFIPYMDFVAMAQQLITTVYHGQPDSQVKNEFTTDVIIELFKHEGTLPSVVKTRTNIKYCIDIKKG